MIKPPDERVIEAFASLKGHSRFDDIIEWLKQSLAETQDRCMRERDSDEVRRLQGAGTDLAEIVKLAEEAGQILREKQNRQKEIAAGRNTYRP